MISKSPDAIPGKHSRKATEAQERLCVEVWTGLRAKEIDRKGVTIPEGPTELRLDTRTVI